MIKKIKDWILKKGVVIVNYSNDLDARNIERKMQKEALNDTVNFVKKNMMHTSSFADRFSLIEYSLTFVKTGLFMEFGVFKGKTINFIASKTDQTVYGFDSFEGLPEDWREGFRKGTFRLEKIPIFRENVKIIEGWFEDTLPNFILENTGDCSFIHIDCDLYSSTKTIFDHIKTRIKSGCVIVFDEFFNYPGWQHGEYKAFMEFVEKNNIKFEYIGYCRYHSQVAVRIL